MAHETRVLLDRAIPLQRAGKWDAALDLFRTAYERSVAARDPQNIADAVLHAGLCAQQMGDGELAMDYLTLAQVLAGLHNDAIREGRALNGLATIYHVHGEFSTAEQYYRQARDTASRAGDLLTRGNVDQNLGSLATTRGDRQEALDYYKSAVASYEQVGHDRGLAGVYNNAGMLYNDLRDYKAAEDYLGKALNLAKKLGDVLAEGIILINRTELLLATGELSEARITCDEAYEIVSRLGENSAKSDVLRLYGIIYRETGKPYLAETHLREAIGVASGHSFPLEEAEAQRELSHVLRQQERNREALAALHRAHELFSNLQAKQQQADIASRLNELEADFLSLVQSWGESIEAKDKYTKGHCQRVADYACEIAQRLGISSRDVGWFRMGAFLHDVGKTEVPGEILNKPGRLTDGEREVMESHTVKGDEILAAIPFPWDIRPMVRSHHERWDGRGYPDGLAGAAIPLSARILRVADVFDALTTTRSYRRPLTADQALQLMQDDHGSFDPEVFEAFRAIFPTLCERVGKLNEAPTM